MRDYTLWHNPGCSKSRRALELLRAHGIEPTLRDYLGMPPEAQELRVLLDKLGLSARQLVRAIDAADADLRLDDPTLDDHALIAALTAQPHLIERPILVAGERAVIARPPERVLELL